MNNPFKIIKDIYIWYCKSCWATGVVAANPSDLDTSIKKVCHNIHILTNISKCNAKLTSIVVHKDKPFKKK
jgi:hypothetical protein